MYVKDVCYLIHLKCCITSSVQLQFYFHLSCNSIVTQDNCYSFHHVRYKLAFDINTDKYETTKNAVRNLNKKPVNLYLLIQLICNCNDGINDAILLISVVWADDGKVYVTCTSRHIILSDWNCLKWCLSWRYEKQMTILTCNVTGKYLDVVRRVP